MQDEQCYFQLTLNKSYHIYIRKCKKKTTTKRIEHLPATRQNVVAPADSFGKLMPSKNKAMHVLSTDIKRVWYNTTPHKEHNDHHFQQFLRQFIYGLQLFLNTR
jgi:hypothetical protein